MLTELHVHNFVRSIPNELASIALAKERFTSKASLNSPDAPKLLELAATAGIRFKTASNDSKREMLSALCSNCIYGPQIHVELKERALNHSWGQA